MHANAAQIVLLPCHHHHFYPEQVQSGGIPSAGRNNLLVMTGLSFCKNYMVFYKKYPCF